MITLSDKIIAYLGRTPDFRKEIQLQDDGDGAYIKEWNATDKPKPTDEQLNDFIDEATKSQNNNQVVATRKSLYGTPEQQLEILVEQGVDKLIERNTKIKTDNPKE